jgi:hypothetical protein
MDENRLKRYFWLDMNRCLANCKDGTRCGNYRLLPYERRPGDLVFPEFCWAHRNQEQPTEKLAKHNLQLDTRYRPIPIHKPTAGK